MTKHNQAPGEAEHDLERQLSATQVTREQVQDAYMVGTSDSLAGLNDGRVLHLDHTEQKQTLASEETDSQ